MNKTIVIVGTLDTKAEEVEYVNELIRRKGHQTIVIDPGVLGEAGFEPDITRHQVAEAAGTSLNQVIQLGDEGKAIEVMAEGACNIVQELYSTGRLDGIVALGGSMGTSLGLPLLKALPLLVPKLLVSTVAFTPIISQATASPDLTVMPTVADIWGLNRITKRVLENAAGAISGMVETYEKSELSEKRMIGVATLGSAALRYVPYVKPLLEEKGYEVAVFHTNGVGGGTFEQFVEQGMFAGALDLSHQELMSYLCGGQNAVNRLEAIGKRAMPHVVAPGAIEWFCWFEPVDTIPSQYRDRKIHMHNPRVAEIEANKEQKAALGKVMAEKLNRALGPTVVLIPTQGFSERDRPGGVFYDPEGRGAFIEALKSNIKPEIQVRELDVHINDAEFAREAVATLDSLIVNQADH